MRITELDISKIMEELGNKPRIFQTEAQFQFELAWELQKKIEGDGNVLLEATSCVRKANAAENLKRKRFYSDIILKSKDDNSFIVIELKYKTKQDNSYGVELTNQGAPDEGRYDYLWDIRRIELLKNPNKDKYDYNDQLGTFLGGYAIILTNENQYWERTRAKAETNGKETADLQFSIGEADKVEGTVDWDTTKKKDWMLSRPAIAFEGDYTFKWKSYYDTHETTNKGTKKEFKYLITKINP